MALRHTEPANEMPLELIKTWWYRTHPNVLMDWYQPTTNLKESLEKVSGIELQWIQRSDGRLRIQWQQVMRWTRPEQCEQQHQRIRAKCSLCHATCWDEDDDFRAYLHCYRCNDEVCIVCAEQLWARGKPQWVCDECNQVKLHAVKKYGLNKIIQANLRKDSERYRLNRVTG